MFLTGRASYVGDVQHKLLDGAAYAVFVRSIYAHALIKSVDLSHALTAPGVVAALSGADDHIAHPTDAYSPVFHAQHAQPLLAVGKVRFVGEPIAVVVANSSAQAVDAAELVVIDYEPLTPVVSIAQAQKDISQLFDGFSNVILTAADSGVLTGHDADRFQNAAVLVRQRFVNPRQVAAAIECRGAAAGWTADGHLHLWVSTQRPHRIRELVAALLGMPISHVHVIAGPFVGGGFGGKGTPGTEEQLIPQLPAIVKRPVRWNETRTENLTGAVQGRGEEVEVWLAGTSDGKFDAIRVEIAKDAGGYPSAGATLPDSYSYPMLTGPYKIDHVEYDSVVVVTSRPPVAALRGAGRAPLIAALERSVDMFAKKVGIDPAEVRRMNLIAADEMPYTTPTGATYDEADYTALLDRVLELANYSELRALQKTWRDQGSPVQLGIGLASFTHKTAGGGTERAKVKINIDGSATVVTGTTSQGHGHAATWAQIASDELGIPMGRIKVVEGVTDEIATGVGAIGSRSLQIAGLAIHEAAQKVVLDSRALASELMEAAVADIMFDKERGVFHVSGSPTRYVGWAGLAAEAVQSNIELSCDHVHDPQGRDVYPSGCHLAVVEVDTETGRWKLVRYIAVDDAGTRVNPMIVDGQLHGGIALGIAQVMGEEVVHDDDGNPLTATFLDYQIASIDQFCQFELEAHTVRSSFNPYGYKAVGESGPMGGTPAVHNAVIDAIAHLGIEHLDIPVTPEILWRAVDSAHGARSD